MNVNVRHTSGRSLARKILVLHTQTHKCVYALETRRNVYVPHICALYCVILQVYTTHLIESRLFFHISRANTHTHACIHEDTDSQIAPNSALISLLCWLLLFWLWLLLLLFRFFHCSVLSLIVLLNDNVFQQCEWIWDVRVRVAVLN